MTPSYFSHDCHARHDPKIMSIRADFGVKAYAWFFMLIEIMREQEDKGYMICLNQQTKKGLCKELETTPKVFDSFIQECCELGLFVLTDDGYLYSKSLLARMEYKDKVSLKRKKAAEIKWMKYRSGQTLDKVKPGQKKATKPEQKQKDTSKSDNHIYDQIYETWSKAGIIVHKKLTDKMKTKMKSALKEYSLDDICKAINNYGVVVNDNRYYFKYRWTLEDFLARGVRKFIDDACFTNYLKDKADIPYKEEKPNDADF